MLKTEKNKNKMQIYTQVTQNNTDDNDDKFCVYSDIFSYTNEVH